MKRDGAKSDLDRLPPGVGRRSVAFLALFVFLVAIYGTAAVDSIAPIPRPALLGAEGEAEEARRREAHFTDGSLAAWYERRHRQSSRVRREVLPYYSLGLYVFLSEGNEHLIVGSDGWLYSKVRAMAPAVDEEQLGGLAGALFRALDRRLGTLGVKRLVLLPVPRKVTVAGAFLPPGVEVRPSLDSKVIDAMIAKGNDIADLRPSFAERHPADLYFQTDTHWAPEAAQLGALALARQAGFAREGDRRLGSVEVIEQGHPRNNHDLLVNLGIRPDLIEFGGLDLHPVKEVAVTLPERVSQRITAERATTPLALTGTSLSAWHGMAALLTHYIGVPVWDGARPAQQLLGTTRGFLAVHRGRKLPRLLFIEIPMHQLYEFSREGRPIFFGAVATAAFVGDPPPSLIELPGPSPQWPGARRTQVELDPDVPAIAISIPAGALAHTGEGVVSLRFSGEVTGAPVSLEVLHANHRLRLTLPVGGFHRVLPLLAAGPTARGVRIRAVSSEAATLVIEALTLVHEAAPEEYARLELDRGGAGEPHLLVPAAPVPLEPRCTLLLRVGKAAPEGSAVSIVVHTRGESEVVWSETFEGLLPGAWIALDLHQLVGRTFTGVEVSAEPNRPELPLIGGGGLVNPR